MQKMIISMHCYSTKHSQFVFLYSLLLVVLDCSLEDCSVLFCVLSSHFLVTSKICLCVATG